MLAIKSGYAASAAANESIEKTNRIAADRGVSFNKDKRLIGEDTKALLSDFVTRGEDGQVTLTDAGANVAARTDGDKYIDAFIKDLELTGKEATEFSLAIGEIRQQVDAQVALARDDAKTKRALIATEAESIKALIGFSSAIKRASDLSTFGDSASNIASGS